MIKPSFCIILAAYFFLGFLGLIDHRQKSWKAIAFFAVTPLIPFLMFFTI